MEYVILYNMGKNKKDLFTESEKQQLEDGGWPLSIDLESFKEGVYKGLDLSAPDEESEAYVDEIAIDGTKTPDEIYVNTKYVEPADLVGEIPSDMHNCFKNCKPWKPSEELNAYHSLEAEKEAIKHIGEQVKKAAEEVCTTPIGSQYPDISEALQEAYDNLSNQKIQPESLLMHPAAYEELVEYFDKEFKQEVKLDYIDVKLKLPPAGRKYPKEPEKERLSQIIL